MNAIAFLRRSIAESVQVSSATATSAGGEHNPRSPTPGRHKRPFWLLVILLASTAVLAWNHFRPTYVQVIHPQMRTVVETLAASGQVHGDVESNIGAESGGRIARLFVREGDQVQTGQVLALLDTRVLKAQEQQARENLNVARAGLVQISRPALPSEIQRIRAETTQAVDVARAKLTETTQRLAELRRGPTPETVLAARGQLQQAQAQLAQARLDLDRQKQLYTDGRLPRSILEEAESAWKLASEAKAAADAQLTQAQKDVEREQQLYLTNARSDLDNAETTNRMAREALGQAQADKDLARQEVERQQRLFEGGATPRSALDRAQASLQVALNTEASAKARLLLTDLDLRRQKQLFENEQVPKSALEKAQTNLQVAMRSAVQAQVRLTQTQRDLARQRQVYKTNKRADLDHAMTAYNVARSQVLAAKANLRDLQLGTRKEALAQAEAEVRAAHSTLSGAIRGGQAQLQVILSQPRSEDVALARAQVRESEQALRLAVEQLRNAVVQAPFGGTVTQINTEVGAVTGLAQPILKLVRSGRLEIRLDVDENNLGRLQVGQRAVVTSNAFPQAHFDARLGEIGSEVDTDRGTVELRLAPVNPPQWLRPGQTLNVNIILDQGSRRLTVPLTSLISKGNLTSVLVVRNGVAVRKVVESGPAEMDGVPIISGLTSGDAVIVSPARIIAGQKVRADAGDLPKAGE